MKTILIGLIFTALAAAVIAQSRPDLSDTFTARVDFVEKFGDRSRSFHGQWFFDFVGRQERFNVATTRGLVDIFRFYNESKEYEFSVKNNVCRSQNARIRFFGIFDWLKSPAAKPNGVCKSEGGSGTDGHAWQLVLKNTRGYNLQIDLCVDNTGKIPYWQELVGTDSGVSWHRGIVFQSYTPGEPDKDTFSLPAKCQQ